MKVCAYCQTGVEDEIIDCPKCNKSLFRQRRKILNNPSELIEYAIIKSGVKFKTEKEKNDFKHTVIKSCAEKSIPITSENINEFIQHLFDYK